MENMTSKHTSNSHVWPIALCTNTFMGKCPLPMKPFRNLSPLKKTLFRYSYPVPEITTFHLEAIIFGSTFKLESTVPMNPKTSPLGPDLYNDVAYSYWKSPLWNLEN